MSDKGEEARKRRLRWITLGEAIAISALVISGLGLWHEWGKGDEPAAPTTVVEQRQAIPLTLRGKVEDDGRRMIISPIESSHALEALTITIPGAYPIELGSDGKLDASIVESKVKKDEAKGAHRIGVSIEARYVEMGKDRTATGNYVLRYEIEGGGLFGGRSLRLAGLNRA